MAKPVLSFPAFHPDPEFILPYPCIRENESVRAELEVMLATKYFSAETNIELKKPLKSSWRLITYLLQPEHEKLLEPFLPKVIAYKIDRINPKSYLKVQPKHYALLYEDDLEDLKTVLAQTPLKAQLLMDFMSDSILNKHKRLNALMQSFVFRKYFTLYQETLEAQEKNIE